MQYWWVNQNQTFKYERQGGFLWAPKRNANGARNPNYDFLLQVQPGDLIFSFVDSHIRAIAMAKSGATTEPKPTVFAGAGLNWQNEGWKIEVEYYDLENPIKPKDHMIRIAPKLDDKYSPLTKSGNGVQAYFFPVGVGLLTELVNILSGQFQSASERLLAQIMQVDLNPNFDDPDEIAEENKIQQRTDIGETQRVQLVIARRGQGVYRSNVRLIEKNCRVTGLAESRHLITSHIKPWSQSTDVEKLDGYNGLLLSPHIDHLFDKGFISFTDQGTLLTSRHLQDQVLDRWNLDKDKEVGKFSREQSKYLEYHRDVVFENTKTKSA